MVRCVRLRPDGKPVLVGILMRPADGRQIIGHTVASRAESLVSNKAILESHVVLLELTAQSAVT